MGNLTEKSKTIMIQASKEEGATIIPKGSTLEVQRKRPAPILSGDDMISSARKLAGVNMQCKKCGLQGDNSLFEARKEKGIITRYYNICKPCYRKTQKAGALKRLLNNPEKVREQRRQITKRYAEKHTDLILVKDANDRKNGKNIKYRQKNREKCLAQSAVNNKIISGKFPKAEKCIFCKSSKALYHHWDYSKPYDVIPVCSVCHGKLHRIMSPAEMKRIVNGLC
jgi:hypothetical protein